MTIGATASLQNLPNNKATRLDNATCVYCSDADDLSNPLTDEHVIGRRFVPRGSFVSGWSLIARACSRCNNEKADLEDDISAITLLPHVGEGQEDEDLVALALRKAKGSRSRRTKKPVINSYEENKISGKLMQSVDVSFGFVAPPQLDRERVRRLAQLHLQGFFYLITYDEARKTGGFIPDALGWLNEASRRDWGNSLQRGFADLTLAWPARVEGTGAAGFFKVAIRRDPAGAELWSFALEWNRAFRIVGFFGDLEAAQVYIDQIPPLSWQRIDATQRMRREMELADEDDRLFAPVGVKAADGCYQYLAISNPSLIVTENLQRKTTDSDTKRDKPQRANRLAVQPRNSPLAVLTRFARRPHRRWLLS